MTTYQVIEFHADDNHPRHREVIKTGLTLEEAREHCQRFDTRGEGWFHGYEREKD